MTPDESITPREVYRPELPRQTVVFTDSILAEAEEMSGQMKTRGDALRLAVNREIERRMRRRMEAKSC